MSVRLRILLALVVLPALALCAANAALSTVLERSLPAKAAALPIVDANAYASDALQDIPTSGSSASGRSRAAMQAGARTFNAEPTNSAALTLIAAGRVLQGDIPTARRLYRDALLVSKRDRAANLWLLEDASQTGRIDYTLDRYDVLLRTGGVASDILFDVLGTALREPAVVPYLEERLVRRPPWTEQFWLRVTRYKAALANVGHLRLRLFDKNVPNPAGNDGEIVQRLANGGNLDIAYALYSRLVSSGQARTEPLDGSFTSASKVPPFDWETFATSSSGAEIDRAVKALAVYSQAPDETLLARRLARAPSGSVSVSYRVRNIEPLQGMSASLRVRCAEDNSDLAVLRIESVAGAKVAELPATGCPYLWLEVWAGRKETASNSAPDDLLFDKIAMSSPGARNLKRQTRGN